MDSLPDHNTSLSASLSSKTIALANRMWRRPQVIGGGGGGGKLVALSYQCLKSCFFDLVDCVSVRGVPPPCFEGTMLVCG